MNFDFNTVYPYFDSFVKEMVNSIHKRISFGNLSDEESILLFKLLDNAQNLRLAFERYPSLSLINLREGIKEMINRDKELDGVSVQIYLRGQEAKKMGLIKMYLRNESDKT